MHCVVNILHFACACFFDRCISYFVCASHASCVMICTCFFARFYMHCVVNISYFVCV